MKPIYHVTMACSFDIETSIWKFENYEKAKAFLHWKWEEYYNGELANQSCMNKDKCYHEENYARITWRDGDYTEFTLIEGMDKIPDEFEKVWRRYI